jgi:hypothetical protein
MAEKLIAGGAWVQVAVKYDGVLHNIGLSAGCSYNEDWGLQPANVLGVLGPVSIDSQNYTCSVNMSVFVPEKKVTLYRDGGEITIEDILPNRDDVQIDGKGKTFEQLVFLNKATQKVIRSFTDVAVASNGEQVSPNAYVLANIAFLAIKRDKKPVAA